MICANKSKCGTIPMFALYRALPSWAEPSVRGAVKINAAVKNTRKGGIKRQQNEEGSCRWKSLGK